MPETNRTQGAPRREPSRDRGEETRPISKMARKRRRPLGVTILIRVLQVLGTLLLIGLITGSLLLCYAAVYVKTAVIPNAHIDLSAYTLNENSVIYYEDKTTGQWRELQTLVGKENREIIEYKDIPEDLINAYVAIEDKRFWQHHGVDWKRTANGVLRMFTGGNIQGGSTITQQLIKNLTEYDDVTVTRKILEIFTALDLEKNNTKQDILTVYFNRIYMGNNCFGVQAAARYYFGKDVWDLNLAECASLAGITNNPSLYAPYGVVDVVRYTCKSCGDYYLNEKPGTCETCGGHIFDDGEVWTNREYNKARQELILKEMAKPDEARDNKGYITEAERDAAIAYPLVFTKDAQAGADDPENPDEPETKSKATPRYSWYVEAVIDDAVEALMEEQHINEKAANHLVFSGGLSIYVPYDPEIQAAVDTVYNDRSNLDQVSRRTGQRLMSAITVVDNSTGYVVAIGNTMEKEVDRGLNPAVHSVRQPGSSIKPLSVYSPAIEMGLITPNTVVDDSPQLLNGRPWPYNVVPVYDGLTTIWDGLTESLNTVAVRVLEKVTPQASFDFLEQKYGITSLVSNYVDSRGNVQSDIDRSPLAMGGLTRGVTTFEMAAAFATFPRNGAFNPATTVLEIKDASGKTIVDHRTTPELIISERTAYYINANLSNAVTSPMGTAGKARISGQTVAGKTGTTNDVFNYWFCGYTSYYTAAVWTGYPYNEQINSNYVNPSVSLWQKVMALVHEGKENSPFPVPGDLVTCQICKDCGKLAGDNCASDPRGNRVQSFRLLREDVPAERCDCHVTFQVCVDSPILKEDGAPSGYYHLAGPFCPEESVKTVAYVNFQREVEVPSVSVGDSSTLLSTYEKWAEGAGPCDVHTEEGMESEPPVDPSASPEPGTSDPPVPTEPYVDPTLPPATLEPTPPPEEPTLEPPPPETPPIDPYVPAGDS